MKFIFTSIFLLLSITSYAQQSEENMDYLLGEFTQKSDLSKNTKLSNAGHTIIYTRDDIERMQARNLKDIVKTLPFFRYIESRYGISNIYTLGDMIPFSSSPIRVYIDEHEITNGVYGSSYAFLGATELEFVDHIEIYYYTPSFEYSVESTYLLIKLHTKVPQRDKGGKVLLLGGSYGSNQESAYYTNSNNNISYFAYISNVDDKRDNPTIKNQEVKKDSSRKHFLGTIFDENNHLLVDAQYYSQYAFANMSTDGTPIDSDIEHKNYQISYLNKSFDNFKLKASYQRAYDNFLFSDEATSPFYCDSYTPFPSGCVNKLTMEYNEEVISSELDYSLESKSNKFFAGANFRSKNIDFTKIERNDTPAQLSGYDTQNIYSLFAQNEYFMTNNSVITAGAKYSEVKNNANIENYKLNLYRLGYVYNLDKFTAKVFYYHTPNLIEPYLYTSWFSRNKKLQPEISEVIQTQLEYSSSSNYASFIYGKNKTENFLYYNTSYTGGPSVDNYDEEFYVNFINLDYKYSFNSLNSISFNYFVNFIKNAPSIDTYQQYGGYIRLLNSYENFDFFNELVYREDSIEDKPFYDYSLGIKYKYSNNLLLSIKGENLLDKGVTQKFYDFKTKQQTIQSTPIDKKVYLTMEYMF